MLDPLVDCWCVAGIAEKRGALLQDMLGHLSHVRGTVTGFVSPQAAFQAASHQAQAADRIVVFGSFITVGAVMACLEGAV